MTRDEAIAQYKAEKAEIRQHLAERRARGITKTIMRAVQVNEISMVDKPAGITMACAVVYPASNRVEKLRGSDIMAAETAKRRRNVMREFTIDEISAVDKPAQAAALAAIIKRDTEPVEKIEYPAVSMAERDAALTKINQAIDRRLDVVEARLKEARTMNTENDDHAAFQKLADDAERHMLDFIAKRDVRQTRYQAQEAWRKQNPTLFKQLQASPTTTAAPVRKSAEPRRAFEKLAAEIAKRDNVGHAVAYERARIENPSAFALLQSA
jgi:hypothetical protein